MKGERYGYKQVMKADVELFIHIPELSGLVETE